MIDGESVCWQHAPTWGSADSDAWFVQVRGKKDGTMPAWARKLVLHAFQDGSWCLVNGGGVLARGGPGDIPSPEYAKALLDDAHERAS